MSSGKEGIEIGKKSKLDGKHVGAAEPYGSNNDERKGFAVNGFAHPSCFTIS